MSVLSSLKKPKSLRLADGVAVALKLIDALRISGLVLEAAELMTSTGVALVHDAGHRRPTSAEAPCYLLVEVSGPGELDTAIDGAWRTVGGVVEIVGTAEAHRWIHDHDGRRRGRHAAGSIFAR